MIRAASVIVALVALVASPACGPTMRVLTDGGGGMDADASRGCTQDNDCVWSGLSYACANGGMTSQQPSMCTNGQCTMQWYPCSYLSDGAAPPSSACTGGACPQSCIGCPDGTQSCVPSFCVWGLCVLNHGVPYCSGRMDGG